VCQRKVLKTNSKGVKTECVFTDGTTIVVSISWRPLFVRETTYSFLLNLRRLIRARDLHPQHISGVKRRDLFQTRIGYASSHERTSGIISSFPPKFLNPRLGSQPSTAERGTEGPFLRWQSPPRLGPATLFVRTLKSQPKRIPAELRLAFKLRTLNSARHRHPAQSCGIGTRFQHPCTSRAARLLRRSPG